MSGAIPPIVSKLPFIGGIVNAVDDMFSSKERKLKNALQANGLITKEQRKLLDNGNAPGYPKGDAGIGPKLRDMGLDPAVVDQLCQQLGVPKSSVDVNSWAPPEPLIPRQTDYDFTNRPVFLRRPV